MDSTDIAIVGAGPAGLAAAATASQAGAQITLIDEYPQLGGQYLKGDFEFAAGGLAAGTEKRARILLGELSGLDLEFRLQTLVWGIEGNRLALVGPSGREWLQAKAIIIATGSREFVYPFPGWTMPGVMTLGAAQIMAKAHGVLPGQRVLLAGSGPLLLVVAEQLSKRGAEVLAVLEATRPFQWLPHAPAAWGNWERLWEGWRYLNALRHRKIPYRFGHTVVRALGSNHVECAIVVRVNKQGFPIPGSEEKINIDALCLGFGFIPNTELTQLAGCKHEFDPLKGGWVPEVDQAMATTIAGIFAAGESAGVAGAEAAMLTGRIAGLAAADRLGLLLPGALAQALDDLAPKRDRLLRFAVMLNSLFYAGNGLYGLASEDTTLCRCEDVTLRQVKEAIDNGGGQLDALKNATRVGQGLCQGRICGPLLSRVIAHQTGGAPSDAGTFRVRPPIKPFLLGDLAEERKL